MTWQSRRKVLKGLAVSVPVTWATPVVESVRVPAHAATSRQCQGLVIPSDQLLCGDTRPDAHVIVTLDDETDGAPCLLYSDPVPGLPPSLNATQIALYARADPGGVELGVRDATFSSTFVVAVFCVRINPPTLLPPPTILTIDATSGAQYTGTTQLDFSIVPMDMRVSRSEIALSLV